MKGTHKKKNNTNSQNYNLGISVNMYT